MTNALPDPFSDNVVNKVAKAIFDSQRKHEIDRITKVEVDLTKFDHYSIVARTKDPYKILISGWALVSYAISQALRVHASHSPEKDRKELFDPMGPLGTDSGRVRIARAFGWIPSDAQHLLDQIRKSRNRIAHEVETGAQVDLKQVFASPYSQALEHKLESALKALASGTETIDASSPELRWSSMFALLAQDAFEWVLWGPSRERLGLTDDRSPVFFSYDEAPEWARDLSKAVAGSIYAIHRRVD